MNRKNLRQEPIKFIGSTGEIKYFTLLALTNIYAIVLDNNGDERCYLTSDGTSPTGVDWYKMDLTSLRSAPYYDSLTIIANESKAGEKNERSKRSSYPRRRALPMRAKLRNAKSIKAQ